MAKNTRVTRTNINGQRRRLVVRGQEPGYEYRIVNDVDDRIQAFIDRGYEIVTDTTVQVGDKRVANPTQEGTPAQISVGQGVKAYVMRIKSEFYEEDKAAHNAHLDELENQLHREAKEQNFYGTIKTTL